MGWIRWKYILPRLMLCALSVLFVLLATNPLIRLAVVRGVQSVTGAQVDMAGVRASWRQTRVQLINFAAANPHDPMKNLFEAELVDLKLDRERLLQRQIVVKRGRVIGLELGTDRESSGALTPVDTENYRAKLAKQFDGLARQWLQRAAQRLQTDLDGQLDSIQLARELMQRWPAEYDGMESRAAELKYRITELRKLLRDSGENPLRNHASYEQAIAELDGLGRGIFEVRGQVDRIRQQMMMDREAVSEAVRRDVDQLQDRVHLTSLDADALSEYLLGPEMAGRIQTVIQGLQWSRCYVPALTAPEDRLHRGKNMRFDGLPASPDIQIDTLVLQGTGRFGSEPVPLEGTIRGLSSNPRVLGRPIELAVQTTGPHPVLVQATLDATGEVQHDRVLVDCPRSAQPQRLLGNPDQLAVAVSAGEVHLWIRVDLNGDALSGEILMKQVAASMTPQLHPDWGGGQVAQSIASTLSDVESLDVSVQLSGTLTTPTWTLRSNVGPHLAQRLRRAVESQVVARHTSQLMKAHDQIDAEVRIIEQELLSKQQSILESLQIGSAEIEQVRSEIASRVDRTDGLVDPNSPLRETFQR